MDFVVRREGRRRTEPLHDAPVGLTEDLRWLVSKVRVKGSFSNHRTPRSNVLTGDSVDQSKCFLGYWGSPSGGAL